MLVFCFFVFFSSDSQQLEQRRNQKAEELEQCQQSLKTTTSKYSSKQKDLTKAQAQEKQVQATFTSSLGENHKFEKFLTKVFKKKIKRAKKNEKETSGDGSDSDSENESDEEAESSEDDMGEDSDDEEFDDTVCPPGCDRDLFNRVSCVCACVCVCVLWGLCVCVLCVCVCVCACLLCVCLFVMCVRESVCVCLCYVFVCLFFCMVKLNISKILLYTKVLEMREQRLDAEEILAEEKKTCDTLRKESDALGKKEKLLVQQLAAAEKALAQFQLEKQAKLNELDVAVTLRAHQILYHGGCEGK